MLPLFLTLSFAPLVNTSHLGTEVVVWLLKRQKL